MLSDSAIRELFDSELVQRRYSRSDHPTAPAALPDASLEFLTSAASHMKATSVFEFGSGRSSETFLQAGLSVTSLENSQRWMGETLSRIPADEKPRHTALVRPLRLRFHGLIPVLDWPVDATLASHLSATDLILVDSPYYAPFRESTLWSALMHSDHAVVILDDTRIPTLARFCDRIASENPSLLHCRVEVGHSFDLFARIGKAKPVCRSHSPLEVLKGWRRFFAARAYAS